MYSEEGKGVEGKETSVVSFKVTRSLLQSSLLLLSAAIDVASAPGQHISSLSAARMVGRREGWWEEVEEEKKSCRL